MGKHILKCKCGREHDISEMFGRVVKEWVESSKEKPIKKIKSIRKRNRESYKKAKEALDRLRSRNC